MIGEKPKEELSGEWTHLMEEIEVDLKNASKIIYKKYIQQPHAKYSPKEYPEDDKHFGFFSYDYYPNNSQNNGKNTIKIHYLNSKRGQKSGLHPDFKDQRTKDLQAMFQHIQNSHQGAEEVIGGSWLYHLPGYRENFPQEYLDSAKRLVPPELAGEFPESTPNMSFQGNSLWGQFVNRNGHARKQTHENFLLKVVKATTKKELIEAFPEYPLQPNASINTFYEHLNIEN